MAPLRGCRKLLIVAAGLCLTGMIYFHSSNRSKQHPILKMDVLAGQKLPVIPSQLPMSYYNVTVKQRDLPSVRLTTGTANISAENLISTKNTPDVNPHDFKYIINRPNLCEDHLILIIVHSKADNFGPRRLIRQTWASVGEFDSIEIQTVFMLARTTSNEVQRKIFRESKKHNDIIQEDFLDHYRNLTYKHLMGYKWAINFCNSAQFIVKVDDDVIVNVFTLVQYIKYITLTPSPSTLEDYMYCSVYAKQGPRREKSDKWYVSKQEYPDEKYPNYCEGFAYIVSKTLISRLYVESLKTPYFWIDDVYVTGFLMQRLGIKHVRMRNPNGYGYMSSQLVSADAQKLLFVLAKYNAQNQDLWTNIWKEMMRRSVALPQQDEQYFNLT